MIDGLFIAGLSARDASAAVQVGHSAHSAADRARSKAEAVEVDVEKLFLVTHALWSLLKDQHGYSDQDLVDRVTQIDLMDGKLDGKLETRAQRPDCEKCNRKLMAKRDCCMYCGHRQSVDPFTR